MILENLEPSWIVHVEAENRVLSILAIESLTQTTQFSLGELLEKPDRVHGTPVRNENGNSEINLIERGDSGFKAAADFRTLRRGP